MVGLVGAGLASFCFHLQPELDKPANSCGKRWIVRLLFRLTLIAA